MFAAPWKSGALGPREPFSFQPGFSPRGIRIHTHNLCFLGFGNVNRTLVQLLHDREHELSTRHGIAFRITGIASRRLGWIANAEGLDARVVAGDPPAKSREQS